MLIRINSDTKTVPSRDAHTSSGTIPKSCRLILNVEHNLSRTGFFFVFFLIVYHWYCVGLISRESESSELSSLLGDLVSLPDLTLTTQCASKLRRFSHLITRRCQSEVCKELTEEECRKKKKRKKKRKTFLLFYEVSQRHGNESFRFLLRCVFGHDCTLRHDMNQRG